jgi:hypothetical protein
LTDRPALSSDGRSDAVFTVEGAFGNMDFGDLGVNFLRFAIGLAVGDNGDDAVLLGSNEVESSGFGGPNRRTRRPRGAAVGDAVVAAAAAFSPPLASDACD